jgi:MFS transporter, MFS domain-containing protein family, molybdate-anion transporter
MIVYLLAAAGDWFQGPYVYALYESYGMTTHDIEVLFVAGFGSSMLFGTIVGSVADKYGRRTNCILYGVLYGLACITKHFNNFSILMVGRLLGGIATSILYSAFESWLIHEHHKRGFETSLLGNIFSHAVVGNSLVAIGSGLFAQKIADFFGYVAPFDASLTVLAIMSVVIAMTWVENYGDASATAFHSFGEAFSAIKSDPKILCLGLIQSLFEGAMYTFVLEWTPALTPVETAANYDHTRKSIPHGYIFAAFMVAVMIGSSLFDLLRQKFSVEFFMRPVLVLSAVSLLMPILFPHNQLVIFSGFLVFEICVGIFWPSMSTMRDRYVPEATRATIMNFFRIPLNLIVVVILLQNLSMKTIFKCCVTFLFLASIFQHWLSRMSLGQPVSKPVPADLAETTDTKPDFEETIEEKI